MVEENYKKKQTQTKAKINDLRSRSEKETCLNLTTLSFTNIWARGCVVVKALRYKPAGRGFDSRWFHWNFSVT
jgi:hypothetical protein